MGFSFLKKNKTNIKKELLKSKTLILEDKVTQVVRFFKNEEEIDYKETLMILLRTLNLKEFKEAMFSLESNKYNKLLWASEEMRIYNPIYKKFIYGFETKIKQDFLEKYQEAKISLATGDLVAFLLKYYFLFTQKTDKILEPTINNVLLKVVVCLKENVALLEKEMNHQLYVPISKALYVFFLYDKKEGESKFKNIIRRDLEYKNTNLYELEYLVTVDRFFERLGLDYIPRIDIVSERFDLIVADKENSISKEEVYNEIDKADFFNKKVPLSNFDASELLNPRTNILNVSRFAKSMSSFFEIFYTYPDTNKFNFDIGEVFVENITQPYPKYSDETLIRVREIIKDIFSSNEDVKIFFLALIFNKITNNELLKVSNKFPKVISNYLGKPEGFGERTIKNYLIDSEVNPIQAGKDYKKIDKFFKNHAYIAD